MASLPLAPGDRKTPAMAPLTLAPLPCPSFPSPVSLLPPGTLCDFGCHLYCRCTTPGSLDPNEAPLGPIGYPGGENSLLASEWSDALRMGRGGLWGFE